MTTTATPTTATPTTMTIPVCLEVDRKKGGSTNEEDEKKEKADKL
ncbi:hypothetical protein CSUI_007797 [Cystoisospora suis]|uniref:Uncharacterized protein n=1 Tax=Cystoisospora suis TaxID=483139 RepID=A0A2C6JSS7_9APIC|nr:hypothetical protein CSUI_007797 [Cystoisospora suis]